MRNTFIHSIRRNTGLVVHSTPRAARPNMKKMSSNTGTHSSDGRLVGTAYGSVMGTTRKQNVNIANRTPTSL